MMIKNILLSVIAISIAIVAFNSQTTKSYSFEIDEKWIGKYITLEKCIQEEKTYHYIKNDNRDFDVHNSTCEWN